MSEKPYSRLMPNESDSGGERAPLILRDWAERLAATSLKEEEKRTWQRQLVFFFSHCKKERALACVATCRSYLERLEQLMP